MKLQHLDPYSAAGAERKKKTDFHMFYMSFLLFLSQSVSKPALSFISALRSIIEFIFSNRTC